MRKLFVTPLVVALGAVAAFAQPDFHKNNLDAGIGAAIPTGQTATYLSTAPMFDVHYGYRFVRFFQADAGFQMAWGAAGGNQNAVLTDFGPIQGGDHEWMIPLGGRFIVPQPLKRIEVGLGGGAVYMHYKETAPSNGYYQNNCYSCTSRGGWGGYGLTNLSYFLDESGTFRVGTTFQYISAATTGDAVGNIPGLRTSDHWATLTFGFGLSF
jgi:hypothetical protein